MYNKSLKNTLNIKGSIIINYIECFYKKKIIFIFLGHGDCSPRLIPTHVKSLCDMPVGYVACGSTHTLACSRDGNTVWSFGSGDNGKLGHGNTLRLYKPQKIDGLRHYKIKKVAAGIHFSVALTCTGEVCNLNN